MKQQTSRRMRFLPVLIVVAGLGLPAQSATPGEERNGICVGGMQIVACVPPEHL